MFIKCKQNGCSSTGRRVCEANAAGMTVFVLFSGFTALHFQPNCGQLGVSVGVVLRRKQLGNNQTFANIRVQHGFLACDRPVKLLKINFHYLLDCARKYIHVKDLRVVALIMDSL